MEILAGFSFMLCCFIVWKEIQHRNEMEKLLNKLLAKNFVEYTNCEIASKEIKHKPKQQPVSSKISI